MAGSTWSFAVLGPLRAERDGVAVGLPAGRPRTLLALLLRAAGGPVTRDRLIGELWGEQPPVSAVSAFHVHLSKLRAVLGDVLVSDASGYSVDPARVTVDAWRFSALVAQARREPGQAHELLGEALALFRGEPLSGLPAEGGVRDWQLELDQQRLQALLQRIDADLAAGGGPELISELSGLVADHQYEERLLGQLMLALYRSGRQADALEAFRSAQRRFSDELGLGLGAPLQELQRRILSGDPTLRPAAAVPLSAPAPAKRPASNLPRPPTSLVGRERELGELAGLAADPDSRLITLTGLGGVGKSRLLLELARAHEPDYRDGVVFVALEHLWDPGLVGAEIAAAVAQRDRIERLDADALSRFLRDRELLLVLDNFEQLVPAAVFVAQLISLAPQIRVLVSSRTPLQIRGERVFEVEPLALPAGGTELEVGESPAVQLFLQCALAANGRLRLDPPLTRTVASICRAVDGLPLAIELAASRMRSLGADQIAEQLEEPLSIGHTLRDLPERQQTLEATLLWSYDLLTLEGRLLLRHAGTFVAGFSFAALEAVTAEPAEPALDELIGASLVVRSDAADRYELLGLVRAFAAGQLAAAGEATAARARHRDYFRAEVGRVLPTDHANCRAALEDAIDAGDEAAALDLARGLRPLWHADVLRQEAHELIGRLLDACSLPPAEEIELLRAASFLDHVDSSSVSRLAFTRRLAVRAEELGDLAAQAIATGNLLGDAVNARDEDEISRLKPTLLALAAADLDASSLAWIHYNLALEAYAEGNLEEACAHATRSVESSGDDAFTLAVAMATRLLARSGLDGLIPQPALAEAVELLGRQGAQPMSVFGLWFVARYAVTFAPDLAAQWLGYAERIVADLDAQMWPESVLRDETLALLAPAAPASAVAVPAEIDHRAALAEAGVWLAARDPGEAASRTPLPGPAMAPAAALQPPVRSH